MIFRDRVFGLSFAIALVWHLFWLSAVVVVTPKSMRWDDRSRTDFLGPLLDKTMFDMLMQGKPPLVETRYRIEPLSFGEVVEPLLASQKVAVVVPQAGVLYTYSADTVKLSVRTLLSGTRKLPSLQSDFSQTKQAKIPAQRNVFMEGPAGERAVLYLPEQPALPDDGMNASERAYLVRIRFYVSPDGMVERAEPFVSSGSPEVDLAGVRYLRRWRFEPSSDAAECWGIVDLRFRQDTP